MTPDIQILLGTYNEGAFVDAFFESLLAQTNLEWQVIARDDGSTDDTAARLAHWQIVLGSRMRVLPDSGSSNLGIAGNFSRLLASSSAPWIMLANPDDVWFPEKIQITWNRLIALEADTPPGTPCLVHTDVRIVDRNLNPMADSLWAYQGIYPSRSASFATSCIENTVGACTLMMNRPLIHLVGSIPAASHNEDWWVCMVAKAFGRVAWISLPTMDWRRHGANNSEASTLSGAISQYAFSPTKARARIRGLIRSNQPRVEAFLERFGPRLSPADHQAATAFLALLDMGPWARRLAMMKHGFHFGSITRTLGMFLFL